MKKYDVALSFAGEDRPYVEQVAACLSEYNIKVFYDESEEAVLWGKDLYEHLDNVYRRDSKYCVMFLSKHYKEKLWTNHERTSAQARAFQENQEYILPVRFDNTEIPGIRPTIGYINGSKKAPIDICELILQKLGIKVKVQTIKHSEDSFDIVIPKIKKSFSDLDRKRFTEESFKYLKQYFSRGLKSFEESENNIQTDFTEVNHLRFIAEIYISGQKKASCTIWMGSEMGSGFGIYYVEGAKTDSSNSYNDYTHAESDGNILYFKLGMLYMGRLPSSINAEKAQKEDLAKYFWHRLTEYLNQ